jgi:hypothetical protein
LQGIATCKAIWLLDLNRVRRCRYLAFMRNTKANSLFASAQAFVEGTSTTDATSEDLRQAPPLPRRVLQRIASII